MIFFLIFAFVDKGTDEVSKDESVRSASRAFQQTFDIAPMERLVNCNKFGFFFLENEVDLI
jgi:hypothetical protein